MQREGTSARSFLVSALLIAFLVALLPVRPALAEGWTAPTPERVISGASRPEIAAWGLAYNQLTGELLVGDYISSQIRRYSLAGEHLGDFSNPKGSTEGVASALAVDPRDGSTYVAVTGDGKTSRSVRKYGVDGQFLFDFNLAGSVTWLTVDSQGDLWAPQAFGGTRIAKWRVDDATKSATSVLQFGSGGTGPGRLSRLTGIAVDGSGNSYVADPGNRTVHSFDATGKWRFDMGAPGLFPGDIRGVAVDGPTVYVANSQAGTIESFDTDGAHVRTISGIGSGDGQFLDGARQITTTPDGSLWAADYGARRVLQFAMDGSYLSKFPKQPALADEAGLTRPRGIAFDRATGGVITADSWNQRVQRFTADGSLDRVYGQRGTFPPDGMNYPRSVGVDPATNNIWIVNYEGRPNILVVDSSFNYLRRVETPRFAQDIEFFEDSAYVLTRRTTASVRVYDTRSGVLKSVCCTNLGNLRGIAVDPNNGNMWLTSDSSNNVYVVDRAGALLKQVTVDNRGWGVDIVGDTVYVADANANKIFAFNRTTYARLGSFGSPGTGLGQFRGPSGITHDDQGKLYVVEDRGARVQVFSLDPKPAIESTPPSVAQASASAGLPLRISGTATDASGIATVEVAIRDNANGTFWNATRTAWDTKQTWNQSISSGPLTSMDWRFTLVPAKPGVRYTVRVRATDIHGNRSPVVARTYTAPAQ